MSPMASSFSPIIFYFPFPTPLSLSVSWFESNSKAEFIAHGGNISSFPRSYPSKLRENHGISIYPPKESVYPSIPFLVCVDRGSLGEEEVSVWHVCVCVSVCLCVCVCVSIKSMLYDTSPGGVLLPFPSSWRQYSNSILFFFSPIEWRCYHKYTQNPERIVAKLKQKDIFSKPGQ